MDTAEYIEERVLIFLTAAVTGDVTTLERCIAEDTALLRWRDLLGNSALHYAVQYDNFATILTLKNQINVSNDLGQTPLIIALLWGRVTNARLLIALGAAPPSQDAANSFDILALTVRTRSMKLLRTIIEGGYAERSSQSAVLKEINQLEPSNALELVHLLTTHNCLQPATLPADVEWRPSLYQMLLLLGFLQNDEKRPLALGIQATKKVRQQFGTGRQLTNGVSQWDIAPTIRSRIINIA